MELDIQVIADNMFEITIMTWYWLGHVSFS